MRHCNTLTWRTLTVVRFVNPRLWNHGIRPGVSWRVLLSKFKAIITSLLDEPSTFVRHAQGCGILAGQGLEFVWRCTKYKRSLHTYGSGAVDWRIVYISYATLSRGLAWNIPPVFSRYTHESLQANVFIKEIPVKRGIFHDIKNWIID